MTHCSYHYLICDFTHTYISNNLPLTCESLPLNGFQDLFVDHEQVLFSLLCFRGFSFNNASFIGLHMSTPHIIYLWEPGTSPLSSIIGNTPLLGLFPRSFVGFMGLPYGFKMVGLLWNFFVFLGLGFVGLWVWSVIGGFGGVSGFGRWMGLVVEGGLSWWWVWVCMCLICDWWCLVGLAYDWWCLMGLIFGGCQ